MDQYEEFRNRLLLKLSDILPDEMLIRAMGEIDAVSNNFDITQKSTDIIPYVEIPESVKLFIASKLLENASKKTLVLYKGQLVKFINAVGKRVEDITANDIRGYLYSYKEHNGIADTTLDTSRRIISSYFGWLTDNEYIQRNPAKKISKIKCTIVKHKPITMADIERMRMACDKIRDVAILDFLFSTGCRASECVAVNLDDIDWANRSVIIRHGKGDKQRTVYFSSTAEVTMKAYLKDRKIESPALFCGDRCDRLRLGCGAIEDVIKNLRKKAGITKECTPHTLRRTFATVSVVAGMPLERLQMLMGHSKPETTMIYTDLDNVELQAAHRKVFA